MEELDARITTAIAVTGMESSINLIFLFDERSTCVNSFTRLFGIYLIINVINLKLSLLLYQLLNMKLCQNFYRHLVFL